MKLTITHTDSKKRLIVSNSTMESLVERMAADDSRHTVTRIREMAPVWRDPCRSSREMPQVRLVRPAAQFAKDVNGNMVMKENNGVAVFELGGFDGCAAVDAAKRALAMLPSTLAVFEGADGMSAVVLVRYSDAGGKLPEQEEGAEQLYGEAFRRILPIYRSVVDARPRAAVPSLRNNFVMTVDPSPYYNAQAVAMRIDTQIPASGKQVAVAAETDTEGDGETCSDSVQPAPGSVRDNMQRMMRLLADRYRFRYNTVMKYVEYQSKERPWLGFMPLTPRVQKRMTIEVQLNDIRVSIKDVRNFLESDLVGSYDPISDFLSDSSGKWDGKDHIRALAHTVPTANPHWEDWFYTWFLGMVSQWQGNPFRQDGNSVAPLLVSRQGYNKSTFCRRLLPPELQWGYSDNLILSEKRQVYQAMSQFLLINLDEFNQISPKVQQGFLKNLIQLPALKLKRPYGSHVEQFPRLASFIATSNLTDILADPSGNRRFIGVELTGPIDVSARPNYQQLYAQALAALDNREKSYFDDTEVKQIMRSNADFELVQPEEQYFNIYYETVADDGEGEWLSAAEIFDWLKKQVGSSLRIGSMISFGRRLANMPGLKRKRFADGMKYLVRKRQ